MTDEPVIEKTYLGDGLYANFDGYQLVLTAEDGIRAHDTVYLEPSVYFALTQYAERIWGKRK